ncbi:ABC transporter substrate-binding protein [uncultured Enterococcus sp.]|uniref:ABC transporter substrate-binding protein n=1 Tax=uncultured Enterococcus sp. TaxID=167972 RepID=UPI002AA7B12B|nr:ABC transporter substrate-binding protein [uncultured Enterococcus sp.]
MTMIRLYQNKVNPLVLPVILADRLGYFDRYQVPVDLELSETFQFHSNKSFTGNNVDAVMGDLTFFFDYLSQGKEAIVTSTLTRTIKLVGYQNAAEKKGIRVGAATKGLFPFFLDNDLMGKFDTPKISWIDNTFDRIEALRKREIDALVAIEPFIYQTMKELPVEVLWDSKQSDKTMVMWCFDKAFYLENQELVKNYHLALEAAAADFNQLSSEKKVRTCIEIAEYTEEAAHEMAHFLFEPQQNYSARDFQLLADWLSAHGKLNQPISAADYIADVF